MATIQIRYEPNKSVNFVHIVNYLVGSRIMTLDESICFYRQFKLMEDITFRIPDEIVHEFKTKLDCLNCEYE